MTKVSKIKSIVNEIENTQDDAYPSDKHVYFVASSSHSAPPPQSPQGTSCGAKSGLQYVIASTAPPATAAGMPKSLLNDLSLALALEYFASSNPLKMENANAAFNPPCNTLLAPTRR